MKRKHFILALVAMLLSFVHPAFAQTDNVAKVGNTEYATIDEAIAAWTNNTTLTLLDNVTLSDVVTLNSTEHHILDLGTYTMTAASGKNAIVIKACGTGDSERTAITIKADDTNPGGINAGSKCVVYYKYADGGISGTDRPIIKIEGGVFTGSTSSWGTAGIYTIGKEARKCATLNISGGTFNCTINGSGKSKLIISGGVFNYSVGSQGDSTALRLISGGTFKTFGFMTADSNNTKFWFGTSMGNSNVGVHVDDNGCIVVGGAVVTEAGDKFEASSTNYSGANSLLQYSSAKDNGLYYTSVEEAFADNNTTNGKVTVYADEVDMSGINFKGTIVVPEGNDITITNAPSSLKVQLSDGTVLTPDANGTVATKFEVSTLAELQAALAAENELPIVITAQIEIPAGETVELDLNGKTVNSVFNGNSTTNHIYALSNKGTLTIKDSEGNGSINSRGIYNYGSLTLNAGAINAIDGNGGYAVNNQSGSTFVMNGGVVAATNEDDHQSSSGGYDATALKVPAGCTATLNGGTINDVCDFTFAIDAAGTLNIPATSTITVNGTHGAIYVSGGETTINAGTFQIPADNYSRTDNVLYVTGGSLVVNGGTFIGDSDTASGGSCLCDEAGKAVVNGGTFKGSSGGDVWGTTGTTIKGGTFENLTEKQHIAAGYELNADGTVAAKPVAEVNGVKYATFAEAAAAAQAGSEIKLLANIEGDITVPANVTLNGNGFAISGGITAAGEITFAGVTKPASFNVENTNTVVNIPADASLQLTGTGRMVIGHGCTFNITGTIADAKTANVADVTPSLVMPGASFTGAGVTFNVTNAYISAPSSYCSSSKTASGTFDFNINNSIWENAGKLAFESQSTAATVNFDLIESVLNTGSHLVFGVSRGEVLIDNSNVNVGKSNQIENQSTMTIKNGSVVNGSVATNSNAKNPGTIIVENATYAVTGEFSGSDLGTGTLIIKKGATVSAGSITKANITVDAEGMTAADEINLTANLSNLAGELSVINNDKLEASIVNGKVVLAAKPVAKIGEQGYATLEAAFAAATEGQTITMLDDATPALTSQRAITKAALIDLGGKTMTLTEDDLYFGTTTFKNGTIVVDPSVKPSTAVFWMFANQTLTFDNVKIVATGVTGTYLIGLEGENSDLNLLNGSEILVENTTALDLDIICVNGTNTCDIKVENSKVNVTNLDGRVFFRGNYTVKDSEVNLAGITKAGFRIEAGQTLSIEGTSKVNIEGEPRDGGIHMTDLSATYTKAETATVNATVNEPKVAKVGENTYRTLAQAVAAVEDGGTITLIANETFTETNRTHNSGTWYDGLYYVGDKSFTIDLGGFTISQDGAVNDYLLNFKNSGSKANTITLKNGTIDAGTAAFCAICTSSSQANKLTINTEDINIINNISNGSTIKLRGGAVLNVKDGTKITGKNSYLGIECVASTVNIYDGAEIYMNGTSSYNGCLVGACAAGTVNVYGGYGKGVKGGFIAMTSGGTINIEGGEWIANTDGTVGNNSNLYVLTAQSNKNESGFAGPAIINVTGGTFRGGMDAWVLNNHKDEKAELNISGGNFNANPTKYVEDDYIAVENNGVWNVVRAAAKIETTGYATLAEAVKAVKEGETITILAGTRSEGTIKLPATLKNVTIKGESVARSTEGAVLKDMTISAADGNAYSYVGLTFDGITFDNSRILLTGWRNGDEIIENLAVTNCTFKNLNDNTNTAPIHINKDASEAVNGFTFTNNVIDGATGGSKSGIYAQVTGEVKVENNIINNVSFRPYVIQVTTDDGIADNFTVKGNTFSGSAVGRAQGLGNNAEGTDNVNLVVSNNIFKGITESQQICYWNFNPETTTADLSKNYYDIDIVANPSKIYFNSAAADNYALRDMNVFPIYTALNENGTINTESAFTPKFYIAKVGENSYETLSEAFAAVTDDAQTVVVLRDVTENLTGAYLRGNITTENGVKVTINLTNSDWVACPYTFVIGENVTLKVPALFYYAGGTQINGTVIADAYYQRYGGTKLTINEPGSMTVTSETCIIRYMDGDANAGIYINGDNNDETIGLNLAVAYFYQGMINAKDANIKAGTYWQTNETDGQGSANLVLDNSKLVVSVYDHPAKATGNSTVTLTNGSVIDAKNGGFTYGDNTALSVDATSKIIGKNGETVMIPVAKIGDKYFATLQDAVNASPGSGWGAEVTLLKDVTLEGGYADADEGLRIEKSVTINGAGYTIDCGQFVKGIRIYQNADQASNVMFKNINIVNNNAKGRCIDTRSGKINLMLNGGVNLTAHGTNSQPLTIGGSEAMTKVTISGGTIDAGTSGYAVICFVPVTNHINVQSNAVIKGLAAFYLKEGVTNTAIKLQQATSIGTNKYAAASGDFGAIVIEGSNNVVRLEHRETVVKAVAGDGAEMAAQAAFLFKGSNNTVGYYNATPQVITEGGQSYFVMAKANVTGTKFVKNSVEMVPEAATRGYQFITVEDALRYAKNGDTVKLLANAELDETYVNEKSLTLDLNGKTLSTAYVAGSTTNHLYAIQNNAELTITDSSDAKDGKISARGIFNYGAMTLENGTINAIDGNGGYGVRNYAGATFTMNGGTIATTLEDDHQVNNGGYDATTVRVDEGATFTMNGGELNNICDYTFAIENYGTTTVKGGKATSVHTTVANYGTINIEGGEFVCNGIEGITAHAVWAAEGTTNISGGTFNGKDNYNGFNVDASEGAVVNITGGTFLPVHSGSLYGEGTITVSAGTFFDKIDDARCAVGFQAVANENGTYTVEYTGCRNAMTIVDGQYTEFVNEKEIEIGTLTYQRTLEKEKVWLALYVPFEIPVAMLTENGYEVAYFNDFRETFDSNGQIIDGKSVIEMVKITSGTLKANYPYAIKANNSEALDMEIVLNDVKLYSTVGEREYVECSSATKRFTFYGTYKKGTRKDLTGSDDILVYALNYKTEKMAQMSATANLGAFRIYMTATKKDGEPFYGSDVQPARSISLHVIGEENENGETIIYDVVGSEQKSEAIFDLQGRRVLSPVKGNLYIINGKKVVY